MDGRWRSVCGDRSGGGGSVGGGQLAMGLSDQPARRGCRPGGGRAPPAGGAGPFDGKGTPPRRRARHRRGGSLDLRARQRRRLGLGLGPRRWRPCHRGRPAGCLRPALRAQSRPPGEPGPFPVPSFHGRLARRLVLLVVVRSHAAVHRAVGAGRVGLVGASRRAGHRPWATYGPGHVVSGCGPARRPLRVSSGDQPRKRALRGRPGLVGPRRDRVARLHIRVLGGMILTGVGVGLTLPTVMATAAASLPPQAFATGSAVINMIRQTALALGVAVLIAVLGTGVAQRSAQLTSFQHAWWVSAAISLAGIVPAVALLRRTRPVPSAVPAVALDEM